MSTTLLWFVLAGFLLGFTASTLWEWFYFRKQRVKARDQRVRALEAKLRELEQGAMAAASVVAGEQPLPAPSYRSPGVFLETEEPPVLHADRRMVVPAVPPEPPVMPQPPARPPEQRRAGQAAVDVSEGLSGQGLSARREPLSVRRRSEMSALAARREALRRGPQPPSYERMDYERMDHERMDDVFAPAVQQPSWRDNPTLTERSQDYPDNLSKVKGIGEVYRQRLYKAGIYTWHQVATTEVRRLRQATNAHPSSNVDEWPLQAQGLAESQGRVNAVYSGPPPDELTKIAGIGPVSAETLYYAGICTYEQLAMTPVEELAALFPIAVAGDPPDFARWIAQAVALADAKHGD